MNKRSGIESKKRIIEAATRVFSEKGYAKSSMRMIADASHISIGGLYLYFKNKEDLYMTLMQYWMDDFSDKLKKALSLVDNPVKQIETYITMSLDYAKKHRELIHVHGREFGLSFGMDKKKKFFKSQAKIVEDIINKGIAQGLFRGCNIKEVTGVIRSAIRGFVLSMIIDEDALFTPNECNNLILKGLLRRDRR